MKFKYILFLSQLIIPSVFGQFVDVRTDSMVTNVPLRFKNLNEGNGKVLTSDAIGNASWQTITTATNNWQAVGVNSARGGFNNNITDGTSNTILVGETNNQTTGRYLYGMGWGLELNGFSNTMLGSFNTIPTGTNQTSWVNTDPLLTIGNGQSSIARSNALVIQKNGVVNIGVTPNTSTSYKLKVGGSISSTSTIQGFNLRANMLAGTGVRNVCTDEVGNLIECSGTTSGLIVHNISAMGFHPQGSINNFQRDVENVLASFVNNTKSTEASMYAPVELPDGFVVKEMAFHFKQSQEGGLNVSFMKIPKLNSGPAIPIISIISFQGTGVLEKIGIPNNPEVIDNEQYYYLLTLESQSQWSGPSKAIRGVMFYNESTKK